MHHVLLVAGPPHTAALWADVAERLRGRADADVEEVRKGEVRKGEVRKGEVRKGEVRKGEVRSTELLSTEGVEPTVRGQGAWLAEQLGEAAEAPVLVAHGLACPAAIYAAAQVPGCRLVLCNGPITHLDPATRALAHAARLPALLPSLIFHPAVVVRWLYSSLGLRRAVRNPYVMDRDTVVAICAPLFSTAGRRLAVAAYLRSLPDAVRSTPIFEGPTTLLWGDEDALYPPWQVDDARALLPRLRHVTVPGGRSLHPVERPWLVADAIADLLDQG